MDCGLSLNNTLIEIHIADIHFGAMEPKTEYEILKEQFVDQIVKLPKIDIISIDGDLFDHKMMGNSDGIRYAVQLVDDLVTISRMKNSTLVILAGTLSHDANMLKMFYHLLNDKTVDVRIVESIRFEYIKGIKILCIPELYGMDESIYREFLFNSGWYDECFIHGTFKGAVYGDNVGAGRLFTPEDFIYCMGMVISGHVHKPGCFAGYYYYTGCPIRYKFNEEEPKGYLLVTHDLNTNIHYIEMEEITSFRYDTIYLDQLVSTDPKYIIDYIDKLKNDNGIDYIKIRFRFKIDGANKTIINNFYRNNPNVFVEYVSEDDDIKSKESELRSENNGEKYSYLLDNSISDLERFVMYVNENEQSEFITVDKLKELLSEVI